MRTINATKWEAMSKEMRRAYNEETEEEIRCWQKKLQKKEEEEISEEKRDLDADTGERNRQMMREIEMI